MVEKKTDVETTDVKPSEIKTTNVVSTNFEAGRNEEIKNEGIKNKGSRNMNENEKINFGSEYGSSITESLTLRQYLGDVAFVLDNFNPVERTLKFRDAMPDDESKKIIEGFCKADMPTFLEKSRKLCENCLDVGFEISEIAKSLSRKRKESVEKY